MEFSPLCRYSAAQSNTTSLFSNRLSLIDIQNREDAVKFAISIAMAPRFLVNVEFVIDILDFISVSFGEVPRCLLAVIVKAAVNFILEANCVDIKS